MASVAEMTSEENTWRLMVSCYIKSILLFFYFVTYVHGGTAQWIVKESTERVAGKLG